MTRHIRGLFDELVIDSFAGGGGASTGIEAALERVVDIAINHNPEALAIHTANHPHTRHYIQDVWDVDPKEVTAGRPVGLLWLSPDCRHFSKAKGSAPREKKVRGLAWVAVRWAATVQPRVIVLENVEEFKTWGPLVDGQPCPKRKGQTFKSFVNALNFQGYQVETRELKACDYGAPTTRKRLFLIARRDGQPIVWPEPTHGPGRLRPYRTAAECIDWSIPVRSIFNRPKPLADATCRRIARGVMKFVVNSAKPFVIQMGHGESSASGAKRWGSGVTDIEKPLHTITASGGGAGMVVPHLTKYYGPRNDHETRGVPMDEPVHTVSTENRFGLAVAHVTKFKQNSTGTDLNDPLHTGIPGGATVRDAGAAHGMGLVTAFIAKHYGGPNGQQSPGSSLEQPLNTITSMDHNGLVALHISRQFGQGTGSSLDAPIGTTMTEGMGKSALVAAFLTKWYGTGTGQTVNTPLDTITTADRFGVVTVTIDGELYVITDIGLRMLEPHELARAQGFPDGYIMNPVIKGAFWNAKTRKWITERRLGKAGQVRAIGNSVCPPLAEAIIRANMLEAMAEAAD